MATASLTIRNIPQDVLERLKERAARHRRSMQGEILQILELAAWEPTTRLTASEVLGRVRDLGVSTPTEAADMVRADRDAL